MTKNTQAVFTGGHKMLQCSYIHMAKTTSFSSSYCNQGHNLYNVDWKELRAIFFWPNTLFGKGNDTGWWGSPDRSGSLAILNVSLMHAHLHMYPTRFYHSNSVWEQDHTKVEHIIMSQLQLRMVWPWPDQPDQFQGLWSRQTALFPKTLFKWPLNMAS